MYSSDLYLSVQLHQCGRYHYGNQSVVRECCVADCIKYAALAVKNAMTDQHPAYRLYLMAYDALTDTERTMVPDVWYAGANRGVVERSGPLRHDDDGETYVC